MQVRRFDEAKQYYTRAENLGTPAGDYSTINWLWCRVCKDYDGRLRC